jgi:fructose-1,6-bisphosphatase/inositol monophosphatase family enzyme
MPPELRDAVESRAAACAQISVVGAACRDYCAVATGEKAFLLYYRLLPWDHAPGALILTEAGGVVRHPDGAPYRPTDRAAPTLGAADESLWQRMRAVLFP